MLRSGKKTFGLIALIVLMLVITVTIIYNDYLSICKSLKEEMRSQFSLTVNDLKSNVDKSMIYIFGLRGYVYSQLDTGISQESFDEFAKKTQDYAYYIKNFSIAPDNIQVLVFPLEGNEKTLGHHLDEDSRPDVIRDIKLAEKSKQFVISGPYALRQGGLGMVVRNPIYEDDMYWGLVNIVVDLEELLSDSDISRSKSLIYSISNDDGIFWGNASNTNLKDEIKIGDEIWTITAEYDEGIGYERYLTLIRDSIVIVVIMLVILLLVIRIFNRNIILSSRIKSLIYQDILTSLPNRRALEEALDVFINKKRSFSIAFIDLDNFKDINDSLGHSYGDQLLIEISTRIQSSENTQCYRWGGDEFIILSFDNETSFLQIIREIQAEISVPVTLSNEEYIITCSAGICSYPKDGSTAEEIIKLADTTMYFAKSKGKNSVYVYDTSFGEKLFDDYRIERRLDYALKNGLLELYYQPQYNLKDECIDIVEALARLKDEQGVFIPPNKFIAIAEKSHLIYALDEYVFEKTLQQLHIWMEENTDVKIAVNISGRHFTRKFFDFIQSKLIEYAIEPHLIELEITETVAIEDIDTAVEFINALDEIGIHVALDDFGTGYSSLSYISILKLSSLKIDRSFIKKIEQGNNEYNIIQSVINIVDGLGITSVAEGVEYEEQLDLIRSIGCDRYQGYLLSKPVPAYEIPDIIKKHNG